MYYKVLKGLLACSLATTVFAPMALAANAESRDQSWLDRTDILIKAQENRKPQFAVETLQPINHYDKNSKGLLFLQGKISSRGGDANRLNDYTEQGILISDIHLHRINQSYESIGTTGSIGLGYRHLSQGQHSYVGLNSFYDQAFQDHYKRGSLGAEYVNGENKIYSNIYKNLGSNQKHYSERKVDEAYSDEIPVVGGVQDTDVNLVHMGQGQVASGYDIGYERTFKNARYLRAYINRYHQNLKGGPYLAASGLLVGRSSNSVDGYQLGIAINLTPQLSINTGYDKAFHHSGDFYLEARYTLGKSKHALWGGPHRDTEVTTARSKMLDKVERTDMKVSQYEGEYHIHVPHDHL